MAKSSKSNQTNVFGSLWAVNYCFYQVINLVTVLYVAKDRTFLEILP